MTFGAGTSIQRREPEKIDSLLQYKIATEDQLRIDIVSLAIDNNDIHMLNELRARELPELYYKAHYVLCSSPDFDCRYDEGFIRHISEASNEIVDYFTDEFEIRDYIKYKDGSKRKHIFMFPFISQLMDFLVKCNHEFAEFALKKAIDHNKRTYETLKHLIEKAIEKEMEIYYFKNDEDKKSIMNGVIKGIMQGFDFYENGNIVSLCTLTNGLGIITNIVHTEMTSKDVKLKYLIKELNSLFDRITSIQNEFDEQQKGEWT